MLMTSWGIYGRKAGHRMPRRTLTSPLHLPLPMSILVQYPRGMTRQEHASLSCAAGQRCMSLTCTAASSSGIRRETRLGWSRDVRDSCLTPSSYMLSPLLSGLQRGGASSAALPPSRTAPCITTHIYIMYITRKTGVKQE
jgi:hypothetical protein